MATMQLAEYLEAEKITPAEFARRIKCGRSAVIRWLSGARFPRPTQIHAIELETGGKVTANDLIQPTSRAAA